MGYDGLSGIFAIEFDTQAVTHKNLDSYNQLRISMQVRNKNIKLLQSSTSSTFKSNTKPINFAVNLNFKNNLYLEFQFEWIQPANLGLSWNHNKSTKLRNYDCIGHEWNEITRS